ncbi:MAG: hypothetical protein IPN79_06225 [Saprospiraceae bacterium]|nr:hypothetical protein [Saprospiraceae bacterium]
MKKIISCEEKLYANQTGFVSQKETDRGSVHDENGIRYTFDQITMNYNDKYVIGENESQSILFDETLDVIDSCSFCTIRALDRPQVKYIHYGH